MQMKINVEVKDGKKILRSFKNLPVKLFDTRKENIDAYGIELLHLCFIGTSGKVNIQNKVRSHASQVEKNGEWTNSDSNVKSFAATALVTVGTGSELQSERSTLESKLSAEELIAHNAAMAYALKFNAQAKANVDKRKVKKEEPVEDSESTESAEIA